MKVLITGTSGFIGSNLIPFLNEKINGVEFISVVRKKKGNGKEILWEDVVGADLSDIYAVIHLAGLAHDTKNTQDDDAYYKVNYELTKLLYDKFLKTKGAKFIYVSSVKAAADQLNEVLTETITPSPLTPYGKSKLKAEEYIEQLSLGVNDKRYYILRPCMVHGPGNKGNLNLFYAFVKRGLPYPLGAFDNKRSFLSVENFCRVVLELLSKDVESGVYNLADDEPLSTTELFETIAETIGKKSKVWKLSPALIKRTASIGDKMKLPLNTERLEKLTENYVVSNKKVLSAIGWNNMPVSAKEGLSKTINSFNKES